MKRVSNSVTRIILILAIVGAAALTQVAAPVAHIQAQGTISIPGTDLACPYLSLGSNNACVTALQHDLNQLYPQVHLAEDGDFGQQTLRATKQFQSDHNLKDDGIVGPLTAQKLSDALSTMAPAPAAAPPPLSRPYTLRYSGHTWHIYISRHVTVTLHDDLELAGAVGHVGGGEECLVALPEAEEVCAVIEVAGLASDALAVAVGTAVDQDACFELSFLSPHKWPVVPVSVSLGVNNGSYCHD